MTGNTPLFDRLRPGDRLAASYLNDLVGAIERQSTFGDRLDAFATGAGLFRRPGLPFPVLKTFRLNEALTREATADAEQLRWDSQQEDWVDTGTERTLAGDFFRGYGFEDDLVRAAYEPVSGRWLVVGSGHNFVRGTLDDSLESGGTATLSVTTRNPSSGLWTDSGNNVTVHEAVGLDDPVAAGETVFATWHEQAGIWIGSLAPCPS